MILNIASQTELSGFYIVYNRTAINEKEGTYGISHLIEHLISHNFDDNLVEKFQNVGLAWNAYTSPTNIVFYLSGLDKHVSQYRDEFISRLSNITISNEDFDLEKRVLLEEYTSIFNMQSPSHLLNLYRKKLNTYNSIGKKGDLIKMSLDDCKNYHNKYYKTPSKIINVSKNNPFTSNIELNNFNNNYHVKYYDNKDIELDVHKNLEVANKSSIIYLSPIIEEDWAVIFFINYFLTNGISSHLYKNIRKKSGLAYYIRCNIDRLSDYSGINIISTETDDDKVGQIIETLDKTLSDTSFLTQSKFDQVKNSIINKIDTVEINRYNNVETYIKPEQWAIEKQIQNINLLKVKEVYYKYYNVDNFYKSVDKTEFLK